MSSSHPFAAQPPEGQDERNSYEDAWQIVWHGGDWEHLRQQISTEPEELDEAEYSPRLKYLVSIGTVKELPFLTTLAKRPSLSTSMRERVLHIRRHIQEKNYLWSDMLLEEQQALLANPPQRRDAHSEWLAVRLGRVCKEAATREEVQRFVEDQQHKDPTFYALITRFSDPVPILGGRR